MERGFIISLILAAIVGIFALSNGEKVTIDLIFVKIQMSQAIVIFLCTILGAVIAAFLGWVKTLKLKKEIKELNRKLHTSEDEKNKLKDIIVEKEKQIETLYQRNDEIQSE